MHTSSSSSRPPLRCLLLGVVFVACAPGAADIGDESPVLVAPTGGEITPADIGPAPGLPPVEQVFQASQISVGAYHACTLLLDGRLACWGSNINGKLGTGTPGAYERKPRRSQSALRDIERVSAGKQHTCVVRGANRLVSCWGRNSHGETNPLQPNGSPPASGCPLDSACTEPSTIPNISNVVYLAAGVDHTCAFGLGPNGSSARSVFCWGRADTNLLGGDESDGWPVGIHYPSITALDAGLRFTCTNVNWPDNKTWCFGRFPGANGQLSETSGVGVNVASSSSSSTDLKTVSVGDNHLCLISGTTVRCQGESLHGQTGVITTTNDPYTTSLESVVSGATAVAAGARHTCAIVNGAVKCWGANDKGQLGVGETFSTSVTPLVASLPADQIPTGIAAGGNTTCVRTLSYRLYCWGDNTSGHVGVDSAAAVIATPTRVTW